MKTVLCITLLLVLLSRSSVDGHGYLIHPAGRSSAWRLDSTAPNYFYTNYDDNAYYCGGFGTQHEINGGQCGICGDDFRQATPRCNERGGYYSTGNIVAQFKSGSIIEVQVEVTANHLGTFSFDLFKSNSSTEAEVEVEFVDLPLATNSILHQVGNESKTFVVEIVLPDITCSNCVLRWNYRTGNHAGAKQENFRSCADVMITRSGTEAVPEWVRVDNTDAKCPAELYSVTQQPVTQQPTSQEVTTPKLTTRQPTTPKPTTPQVTTPKPTTQQPTTPQPSTPKPTTPQPTTPKTTTPQPTTPKLTTKPTTKQATTQQPTTEIPTTEEPTTATAEATTATTQQPAGQFQCPALCHLLCRGPNTNMCLEQCKQCPEYRHLGK